MKKEIGAARDQIQATTTLRLHYPTSPNITQLDNFGTRGNVNPYIVVGTRGARC